MEVPERKDMIEEKAKEEREEVGELEKRRGRGEDEEKTRRGEEDEERRGIERRGVVVEER